MSGASRTLEGAAPQPRLRVVPCSIEKAQEFVEHIHRHHKPSPNARFVLAVADETGLVRGVAMVGRPVARFKDDGWTLEVHRVATDGCPNACSALYGASLRAAKAMGYCRVLTYTRADEPGTSLRAAGWDSEGRTGPHTWARPNRHRIDKTESVERERWSVRTIAAEPLELIWPEFDSGQMTLESAL